MNKRVVLDRSHFMGMLRDPDFYDACPSFQYLREAALASWEQYIEYKRANRNCPNCQGQDFRFMRGVIDAFWVKLRDFQKAGNTKALAEVKAFVQTKKNYRIDNVVLYYRRSRTQGKIAKFTIK